MANSRFGVAACLGAALLLFGCVNNTALDDLKDTTPLGSRFNKALFKNYSALARSFGEVGAASGVAFDGGGSIELTRMDSNIGALANSYAEKAIIASRAARWSSPSPASTCPPTRRATASSARWNAAGTAFPAIPPAPRRNTIAG